MGFGGVAWRGRQEPPRRGGGCIWEPGNQEVKQKAAGWAVLEAVGRRKRRTRRFLREFSIL